MLNVVLTKLCQGARSQQFPLFFIKAVDLVRMGNLAVKCQPIVWRQNLIHGKSALTLSLHVEINSVE
jgi:hypothetical protein